MKKKIFDLIANNATEDSFSAKMRRKRFVLFLSMVDQMPKPVKILDVGGTQRFWEVMNAVQLPQVHVTLLNVVSNEVRYPAFSSIVGDATDLSEFDDNEFDIVFSNSVIEHVGDQSKQKQMAQEVMRVGKCYFVQTPNYYFPIEPHFLFIGFQWLPVSWRVFLTHHFTLGWEKRRRDIREAKDLIEHTCLLKKQELLALFPEATLYEEKLFGLTKSLIVFGS